MPPKISFIRTTWRVVFVRDKQLYHDGPLDCFYTDVFDTTNGQGCVHAERRIETMDRYEILYDNLFELTADRPQMTVPYLLENIGTIRMQKEWVLNEPSVPNSERVFCVAACMCAGISNVYNYYTGENSYKEAKINLTSRAAFTDA